MLTLINLFFVPAVFISILYRRQSWNPVFSAELLLRYCIAVACNLPATKVLVVLVRLLLNVAISTESAYYTVLALLSAAVLPYFLELLHKCIKLNCVIVENDES
ncbi:MAG: hypothetical protein VB055_11630 [Oscillospiraceae bacterium]|nr:hypothetical protein [Oscillospiraceae bacterium]